MRVSLRRARLPSRWRLLDRPLLWGLVYLALIPTFAAVYDLAADGFYQTSATHEPGILNSQFAAEHAVTVAILRAEQFRAKLSRYKGTLFGPDELGLTASSTDLLFTLGFPAARGDVVVQLDISTDSATNATVGDSNMYDVVYTLRAVPFDASSLELTLFDEYTSAAGPNITVLQFTNNELDSLAVVAGAEQGNVTGLPGQWWRMVYFSAVTVTTLGFGDIAPTTTQTRMLVTAEAVTGVVFVGLFLNAVARSGGRRRAKQTPAPDAPETSPQPEPVPD